MSSEGPVLDFDLNVPHGPDVTGHHAPLEDPHFDMNQNEQDMFRTILKPDDSFDENGVYWADLPILQRIRFVSKVNNQETKKEARATWEMFKNDPLSPVAYYFRNMVLPGAGLGLEGYVLFSIGNLKPLFQKGFPECWSTHQICNPTWLNAVEYLEICGIIVGQILVGVIGDWIGRRWGLIQDATIMFIGLIMLTASWGVTQNGWVICYTWSLFFYGIGVGGEYPMTATSGMENAVGSGKVSTRDDRLHRGRKVTSGKFELLLKNDQTDDPCSFLDAGLGTILQSGVTHLAALDLPPWEWKCAILPSGCSVDIPCFLRYSCCRHAVASLLSYI